MTRAEAAAQRLVEWAKAMAENHPALTAQEWLDWLRDMLVGEDDGAEYVWPASAAAPMLHSEPRIVSREGDGL